MTYSIIRTTMLFSMRVEVGTSASTAVSIISKFVPETSPVTCTGCDSLVCSKYKVPLMDSPCNTQTALTGMFAVILLS
ncbi:hypothetical protein V1478_012588 [Vespula squamosa]|uniref:Secreted protein n=1 Tax=Vespula squamosa TaxID=30214 RepID=A0ABD2ADL3_VESSQ